MIEPYDLTVAPSARKLHPGVQVTALETVVSAAETVASAAEKVWHEQHDLWSPASRGDLRRQPYVSAYREFATTIGLDPDRQAPSVQSLVDRGLRAKAVGRWPRINPVVDLINAVAVRTMVALGAFDAERVTGSVRLDVTQGGEPFHPLGDSETTLPAGRLVLADDVRVLSLFAQRDGVHQAVGATSTRVLVLGCAVPGVPVEAARAAVVTAVELLNG